jgi:glycosyltransferase involved in cell wall biosynthesis
VRWRIIGISKSLRNVGFAATASECALTVVPYSLIRPLFTGSETAYRDWIVQRNQRQRITPAASTTSLRIVLYIGQLGPGGSERQLCNLACGLHAKGHKVIVLSLSRLEGMDAHYVPILQTAGITVRQVSCDLSDHRGQRNEVPAAPPFARSHVHRLSNELRQLRPDVLHCWLDNTNIFGGMAGILSDVNRIVLSGRSLSPTHFPTLMYTWMHTWYRILLSDDRTVMTNNSRAGGTDYARWLGISSETIAVIYNGLSNTPHAAYEREAGVAFKASLGMRADAPLLGGFFRLSEEKCPLDFLHVLREVRNYVPNAAAVLVGDGPLTDVVNRAICELQLSGAVFRLPRVFDVTPIIAACDIILLTSRAEGTPNVLIEAQSAGVPVVATNAGGIYETVAPAGRRYLCDIHDIEGLAARVVTLLQNADLRAQEGHDAKVWVESTFSLDRMVTEYERLYECGFQSPQMKHGIFAFQASIISCAES